MVRIPANTKKKIQKKIDQKIAMNVPRKMKAYNYGIIL